MKSKLYELNKLVTKAQRGNEKVLENYSERMMETLRRSSSKSGSHMKLAQNNRAANHSQVITQNKRS